ncbi:MAG TPA: DUF6069 family protein [Actinospica sp.]|nr:DUF6069 family protein [Actinospica sp.]
MLKWVMSLARIDFAPSHRQPSWVRVLIASAASIAGSLIADAAIVALGVAIWPATKGYVHFAFADYAKLTVVGVVIACAAWPVVTRVCAAPRWLFLRLAVLVTLVLLLPDVYILALGQPGTAVTVLMVMHLAIGAVTYAALVGIAPVRAAARGGEVEAGRGIEVAARP